MMDAGKLTRRTVMAAALWATVALPALAEKKYTGPRPSKQDVPFLLHAGKLIELESSMASESQGKDGTVYTVSGATTQARTPVPEPIMLFLSNKINPDRMALYKMEARGGNRVLTIAPPSKRKKDKDRPIFLMVTPLSPGLFKVEVNEVIDPGEYCLSPEGSNQVFCFTTY